MADLTIVSGTAPAGTPYPGNFNDFLTTLSGYLTVQAPDELRYGVVSSSTPTGSSQDKIWFRVSPSSGIPQTVNLFVNGAWVEFTQFSFGDMVLVDQSSVIASPWGEGGTTYTVNGQQVLTPNVPAQVGTFKYKVYVGNYS
jgi:hypothetical protein